LPDLPSGGLVVDFFMESAGSDVKLFFLFLLTDAPSTLGTLKTSWTEGI
jgi:hypothetical protein